MGAVWRLFCVAQARGHTLLCFRGDGRILLYCGNNHFFFFFFTVFKAELQADNKTKHQIIQFFFNLHTLSNTVS